MAQAAGYLKLGNISMDGSKVRANASKSKAVSYKRLLELESHLRAEVDALFLLVEQADRHELPEGLHVTDEIALRQGASHAWRRLSRSCRPVRRNVRRPRRLSTKPS